MGFTEMNDRLDSIMSSDTAVSAKVVKLWAYCQIDPHGIVGEAAGDRLKDLIGTETVIALFQITGICLASSDGVSGEILSSLII